MLTPVPQPHWQTKHNASGARMKSCTMLALLTTLPVSVCVCVWSLNYFSSKHKHMHAVHTCTCAQCFCFGLFWFHAINDWFWIREVTALDTWAFKQCKVIKNPQKKAVGYWLLVKSEGGIKFMQLFGAARKCLPSYSMHMHTLLLLSLVDEPFSFTVTLRALQSECEILLGNKAPAQKLVGMAVVWWDVATHYNV